MQIPKAFHEKGKAEIKIKAIYNFDKQVSD